MKAEFFASLLALGAPVLAHAAESDLYCLTGTSSTGAPIFQPASATNPCPTAASAAQLTLEGSIAANTAAALPFGFSVGGSAALRNTITLTTTTPTTLLPAAVAGHGYVTDLMCFRTDAGTSMAYVTLNDTANTPIPLPPNGGAATPIVVPLISTAANTPIQATASTALTSIICTVRGYSGT